MHWNWQLEKWPHFKYDSSKIVQKERQFLLRMGSLCAFLKNIPEGEYRKFAVEILSLEGMQSAKIEGEILDRASLQSSIRKHFGLEESKKKANKESAMAQLLCSVYESFEKPLTHDVLHAWYATLFPEHSDEKYRSGPEPMQIVSNRYGSSHVFFEAPPAESVFPEMERFLNWFNFESRDEPILGRAAVAHVYFESIHPFEDGNGRIGRALVEKVLSQGSERPVLIAVSRILEKNKKKYYAALEKCNRTLDIDAWVDFFSDAILEAQEESLSLLQFLIEKSKLFTTFSGRLNERQEKVLLRLFAEGLEGFKGGLSAENYIAITKTSRATATRDLADLVEKGILVKTGQLRHVRYWLHLTPKMPL